MKKRTKIVCTLGPASDTPHTIKDMIRAGMNVARLNFSHGTYEHHAMLIDHVRHVSAELDEPTAILQDLQGPKIRVGKLPDEGVNLKKDQAVVFDTAHDTYDGEVIPVGYPHLHTHLSVGDRLLLDDGKIETHVTAVTGTRIETVVVVGGIVTSHKGINIPDSHLNVSALTEKDKADAKFGVEHDVDMIALSFVTSAKDILDLRYLIKSYEEELGKKSEHPILIIAKIERPAAVENIEEILDAVDGIMVARGDLGIEIPAAEVPLVQKRLIDMALAKAKPVIVATQMLDSMQKNIRPTRAEVSDVANAVIDHTDAVMLSNETATGDYPVVVVKTMTDIIQKIEASEYDNLVLPPLTKHHKESIDDVMSKAARLLAEEMHAEGILAASLTGDSARLISRNRPQLPIFVAASDARVQAQMNLSWGVVPFMILPVCKSIEELVERSTVELKKRGHVQEGEQIVVLAGEPVGHSGHVNVVEVREVQ